MRLHFKDWAGGTPATGPQDVATLLKNTWNDFGFQTLFTGWLAPAASEAVKLGDVKVLERGQDTGRHPLPPNGFGLPSSYCSLGQDLEYYENLAKFPAELAESYLRAVRDVVFAPELSASFEAEEGYETSLLRFPGARLALDGGAAALKGRPYSTVSSLEFICELPSVAQPLHFRFDDRPDLPNRIAAIVGYNGIGKTRTLNSLAHLIHAGRDGAGKSEHGRFVGIRPEFGPVIYVSYSAFDAVELPGHVGTDEDETERQRIRDTGRSVSGFVYCGLRQPDVGGYSTSLGTIEGVGKAFILALRGLARRDRFTEFEAALGPLRSEPSFGMTSALPEAVASEKLWSEAFQRLSAGHKIVLNIVAQLSAHLEANAVAILDEPELHLHPPLVAALLRAVNVALREHQAFAVIATHSPVVLQEIPSKSVLILRGSGGFVLQVDRPDVETFGETVGALTAEVFSLDSSATDFQGTLRELAGSLSLEEIESLFGRPLGSQARTLVLSEQADMDE